MINRSYKSWSLFQYILIVLTVVFISCEEQKRVIEPFIPSGERVVLLEEFTGKGCNNCPKGSREIENLLTLFPDNLVAVSIHAGHFADPGSFPLGIYDLRSPQHQEILELLSPIIGYPTAAVNRIVFNGDIQLPRNQWSSAISSQLATAPAIDLGITKEYNSDTRELLVAVSGIGKQPLTGDIRLSIMLTESGIIDAQRDQDAPVELVEDYVHNHVLRDMMTPAAGTTILNSITTGQTFNHSFTITLDETWNPQNMEIIAFVSNVDGGSKAVLQAKSIHLAD